MAVKNNVFAHVDTLAELEDVFECAVSPENLYADGERTRAQANTAYKRFKHDYDHRASQIRLAELNAARTTTTAK